MPEYFGDYETTSTITEAIQRYKETLIFNNNLLKQNYRIRYDFKTEQRIRNAVGAPPNVVEKFRARREKDYQKRYDKYAKKLDDSVEPAAKEYVRGLRAAFYGEE